MRMRVLVSFPNGDLAQAEDITPEDLANISNSGLVLVRLSGDTFEYAEVTSRSVEDSGNSLDEVRYDQAVDGRIWEVSAWKAMPRYLAGEILPAPGVGGVTLIDDEKVRESLRAEVRADEAMRREDVHEEIKEEEREKMKLAEASKKGV